ncbi:MAG: DoxX family protein [Bauldia sp.]
MTAEPAALAAAPAADWPPRLWFVAVRAWLARFPLALLQLAIRISLGSLFFNAGLIKLRSFEFAVQLFADEYKVPLIDPEVAAALATFNELVWPVFLFVGFATRFAVLPLLAMDAVILWTFPQAWNEQLLWASGFLLLLTRGAGPISLDALIERWFARRAGPAA